MLRALSAALLLVSLLILTSCGGTDGGGAGPDVTAPEITQVSIDDGATEVGLVEAFRVTFSEAMDAATINDTTLYVAGRAATGYVEYDEASRTASFLPDTLYAVETPHELVVTDEVTDEDGTPLASDHETSFTTGELECDRLHDHLEPNDDIAEATVLGLNEWARTLTQCNGSDNLDYFQFTLAETAKVHARAAMKYCIEDQNWVTSFLRADGQEYVASGTSASTGETKGWYYTFLPGTYWVNVYSSEASPWDYVLYDFMLETADPCRDDAYEDNDFVEEASQIAPNQSHDLTGCMVDADWFWVDLSLGQTLTVTITTDVVNNARHISLFDTSQTPVAHEGGTDNPMSVSYTATRSGTHFVQSRFWEDGAEYEMNIVVE